MGKQPAAKPRKPQTPCAEGGCLCGQVRFEMDVPARWAWHDHSGPSRHAHGAAYATYVGTWRSRLRITRGEAAITSYDHAATKTQRNFCARCGTPLFYVRAHSPLMVNVPRALFQTRTGREPRYHIAIQDAPDWAYDTAAPLGPLKGFPGVVWERPRKRKRPAESWM